MNARITTALGRVERDDGAATHWKVTAEGDLVVHVVLHDHSTPMWALVAVPGLWSIPDEGAEVVVVLAGGVEGEAVVVGLASGATPGQLAPGVTILVADTVLIGPDPSALAAIDGVVTGPGIDPFTGSTYYALGNASSKVRAAK